MSYLCVLSTKNLSGWGNVALVDTISPGFSHWFCVSGSDRGGRTWEASTADTYESSRFVDAHRVMEAGGSVTFVYVQVAKHSEISRDTVALETGNAKKKNILSQIFFLTAQFKWLWHRCPPNKTVPHLHAWRVFKKTDWQEKVWLTAKKSEECVLIMTLAAAIIGQNDWQADSVSNILSPV